MKVNEFISYGANALIYVLAFIQVNEVFQIVEMSLAIVTSLVLIAYRLWKWYEDASKDGKITKEELKDGIDILIDGKKDVDDKIKKGDKKDG